MEDKNLLNLTAKEESCFIKEIIKINIYRGKLYSKYIIFAELILSAMNIFLNYNKSIADFKFNGYIVMYLIMIIVNVIYLLLLNKFGRSLENLKVIDIIIGNYVILMMVWGAIVSLMDQKVYGQIMVYMINVIACSVFYYIDNKRLLFSYFISALILFFGLPFFQQSKDIVLGHYINGIVFLFCSYITSRILYKNLYNNFKSKSLIIEANEKLKNEIEENKIMHNKLKEANKRLKNLSLKDELTNMNNRRALRKFIDNIFRSVPPQTPVSIIMMDIDNFKLYNDKYGHINGDKVIKKVSSQLNETLRGSTDFVARYGGEEFVYIALQTDENEIYKIANKIREKIYDLKIIHEYSEVSNYVTISLGTATIIPCNTNSIYECIKTADFALYQAKFEGKNRIVG